MARSPGIKVAGHERLPSSFAPGAGAVRHQVSSPVSDPHFDELRPSRFVARRDLGEPPRNFRVRRAQSQELFPVPNLRAVEMVESDLDAL